MNTKVKLALAASLAMASTSLLVGSASAAPMSGIDRSLVTTSDVQKGVEEVRWFCRPWGCHWAPGPYWGGYYGGWGWHRGWGWHHWHHW